MKRRFSHAPAAVPDQATGVSSPQPELCPPPAARKPRPAGAGLIFDDVYSASDATWQSEAAEPDDIRKAAQAWEWCEWVRMSLVAAALMAAGVVMAARTMALRAHAQSVRVRYAPSLPQTRTVPPVTVANNAGPATIGAIHYQSDDNSTTVTVELQKPVFFEDHRLTQPDRVYFDLQGTQMPPALNGRLIQVEVTETFVKKIRVAERGPGVTRVVLETTPDCVYSAMIASDPYRLIVKLHAPE
jgi:hypothetical protein